MTATEGALTLRYFASAGAAAGVDEETFTAGPLVADVLAVAATAHPDLATVLPRCALLHGGRRIDSDVAVADLTAPTIVDILPPFAGG